MEKSKPKPEQILMEAIGFEEEDLEANRAGRFSRDQYEEFSRRCQSQVISRKLQAKAVSDWLLAKQISFCGICGSVATIFPVIGSGILAIGICDFGMDCHEFPLKWPLRRLAAKALRRSWHFGGWFAYCHPPGG